MNALRAAVAALAAIALVACSDDSPSTGSGSTVPGSGTSVAGGSTSTSLAATTTTTPPTTSTSTSTTTTTITTVAASTTTSTTLAPGAELVLRPNGLGDAFFGADPDGVITYVQSILGAPTRDTGWIDPNSIGACGGTEFRQVEWNDLVLSFGDESNVTTGRRHFFAYALNPAFGATTQPAGLLTEGGIGVGSTVAQLQGTYPTVILNPGDDFAGPNFFINEGLGGFLTGVNPTDTVTSVLGGQNCGE